MKFTSSDAYLIRTGAKTQHRVLARHAARTRVGANVPVEVERTRRPEEMFGFSSDIVTGGRRQRSDRVLEVEGRITILAKTTQRIGDMTVEDAKAEGHRSVESFVKAWCGFDFEAAPTRSRSVIDWVDRVSEVLDQHVAVLVIEPDRKDHPRLLAPAARPDRWLEEGDHGYTDRPGRSLNGSADPGEAIDTALIDPRWVAAAERRHRDARGRIDTISRRRAVINRLRQANPDELARVEAALSDTQEEAA